MWDFKFFKMGDRVKTQSKLKTTCSETMINYELSQKRKLLGNCEFNHFLTIIVARQVTIFLCRV